MAKKKSKGKKHKSKSPLKLIRLPRWHYYKDGVLPHGDWTITGTDINRWHEVMLSRFPDYKFVTKFREQIDEDGLPIEGTREMAFWFESLPLKSQAQSSSVQEEDFEEDPENQYVPDFINWINPREYWINQEESLPWFPVEAFIEQEVDAENGSRDRTTEWVFYDECGKISKYYEKSPLLEFLEAVPSQEASYVY
jgi:hypothetical protein